MRFFFSSRRRHTRFDCDWSSDVCSSDLDLIDRSKLAAEVFGDPAKLRRLEQILHPRVIARVLEARSMLPDDAVLVVEAIKLLDGDLRKACDRIWVVVAPRSTMIERLAARGIGEREADLPPAQQLTDDQFRAAAEAGIVK